MAAPDDASDSDGPIINDNVIRIQLRKPKHQKWELRTRNQSPGTCFPTIQLFDCEGNLLVETNEDNISVRSSILEESQLKVSKSLKERDFRHLIEGNKLRKHHTFSGGKLYTRIYRSNGEIIQLKNDTSITNIPKGSLSVERDLRQNSFESSIDNTDVFTDNSSYKSSDNELLLEKSYATSRAGTILLIPSLKETKPLRKRSTNNELLTGFNDNNAHSKKSTVSKHIDFRAADGNKIISDTFNAPEICVKPTTNPILLQKCKSMKEIVSSHKKTKVTQRSYTQIFPKSGSEIPYTAPKNKISFLETYLKSLSKRDRNNPSWIGTQTRGKTETEPQSPVIRENSKPVDKKRRQCHIWGNELENDCTNKSSDVEAEVVLKRRLKQYRRVLSEMEYEARRTTVIPRTRRRSDGNKSGSSSSLHSSSSESLFEADVVLNRLRRRIVRNKRRQRRTDKGVRDSPGTVWSPDQADFHDVDGSEACPSHVRPHLRAMGSNLSHHSIKGLKGRRTRSSGDLCNGEAKTPEEPAHYGSVVGEVLGWNRSLPNHLDGNRHLTDCNSSRGSNNNYEVGTYRFYPKGGRALQYRVSKSGSELEPVWKLQDGGCDQGYGSERSPEDEYNRPPFDYDQHEAQLRAIYPFITDENTFSVVVEKDGRGLGMSVSAGEGGLIRIRRLYPPQPAWRTGLLAPRDLLLAANGVPLTGLSTYEALEVLRTTAAKVELRVCRPPPGALESATPPAPPTPPVRTPHPPPTPQPPLDPLNCHPLHSRLSATTSSATTSSSEGRGGRREDISATPTPEPPRNLHLPDLDNPVPVFDVQFGEFDIIMTKINGSLGFTLRKEDHSALGHYVRALVREPALSDGRIQPGDRIVAVNDMPMSGLSHSEAVAFLRSCGSEVRLRLYRDNAATPLSPMSPKDEPNTEDSDTPTVKPKPHLRAEAVSMLCDLAARRLTPDANDGTRSPCLSPRKFRRLTKESNNVPPSADMTNYTISASSTDSQSESDAPPAPAPRQVRARSRPHSLLLAGPPTPIYHRKPFSLTASHEYELNNIDSDVLDAPNIYQDSENEYLVPRALGDHEPVSMPVDLSSGDEARFAHRSPAYQSAVICSDASTSSHKEDGHGLKKWKGVALSPEDESKSITEPKPKKPDEVENIKPKSQNNVSGEPTILTVELNRGWNSRLGFSVQSHPDSGQSYISAVYSDSLAARDGRLNKGDIILQVNDENVTSMKTQEVIDLLRILRGSICITILRPSCQS